MRGRVGSLRGGNVAEEGVLVGDERGLEGALRLGEVGHGDGRHGCGGFVVAGIWLC